MISGSIRGKMRTETVTSAQNPKIKELLALQEKSRLRREKGMFVIEGRRELEYCINAGYGIRSLFVCPEICPVQELESLLCGIHRQDGNPGNQPAIIEIPAALYSRIAYRGSTEGVIAEANITEKSLEELTLRENPLIVVLESVEKPGNLGAVLRSADAAGADAVIVCDPLTDLYNPNLIRASVGALFTVQTVAASSKETIDWLKANNIQILTAQLQDSEPYYETDMSCGTAIVMGTEATGLTGIWRQNADRHIRIPMLGKLDSLNVSVSAAVLLYEAVRQRNR